MENEAVAEGAEIKVGASVDTKLAVVSHFGEARSKYLRQQFMSGCARRKATRTPTRLCKLKQTLPPRALVR